jgi:hypothetical protein
MQVITIGIDLAKSVFQVPTLTHPTLAWIS